ncbi:MAG: hypothetical protein RDV48_24085 [Candidatus Eremiobacteraeota bacterium]|nr:hypothetical protein [Candidatus Eremiobacteraeota bacterium]
MRRAGESLPELIDGCEAPQDPLVEIVEAENIPVTVRHPGKLGEARQKESLEGSKVLECRFHAPEAPCCEKIQAACSLPSY